MPTCADHKEEHKDLDESSDVVYEHCGSRKDGEELQSQFDL